MLFEILKIAASLLGGGLAGAFLNEWLRRRVGRVRRIPLIERVNRLVSPELQGITLARVVADSDDRRLEELKNLREYQLTLRNTAPLVNLQDIEIQFEFPTEDVQAWVERPAMSKTALIAVDAVATDPWKKAFRWRIPHFPSGDSVEFTFRAVDSPSGSYEAALYKSDRVILEKVAVEPAARDSVLFQPAIMAAACLLVAISSFAVYQNFVRIPNLESQLVHGLLINVPSPILLSESRGASHPVVAVRKDQPFSLVIDIPVGNFEFYDLEILDNAGAKRSSFSINQRDTSSPTSITVPPGVLDAGTYDLYVYGIDRRSEGKPLRSDQIVAHFVFSVEFRA